MQNASTADGAKIVQYSEGDGANQQWQLVRVGSTVGRPRLTGVDGGREVVGAECSTGWAAEPPTSPRAAPWKGAPGPTTGCSDWPATAPSSSHPRPQQRLGQCRRGGCHLRRRHDQADRGGPVRRHDTALRHGFQLRRRHVVRARVLPGDGLPRGRGPGRRTAQRMQRRHPADRPPRRARPQGQRPRYLRRTGDAGQVRQEQRLHPSEPAEAGAGQPDAPGHHLLGVLGRISGRLGRVRRRTHRRSAGRGPGDSGSRTWVP